MKHLSRFGTLALGVLVLSLIGAAARAQTPLRVVTSGQTAPKTFVDHGTPTGYAVDITAEALKRAGFEPEIEALPWARAVATAEDGEALIAGFSRTAERDRLFDYSDALYDERVVLVTRRGADFPFRTLADLDGRTIGIQRASSYGPVLEAALDRFHVARDSGYCERLKMLYAGRIDAAIVSGGAAAVRLNAVDAGIDPRDLIVHDVPVAIDPNYIAIAKSWPGSREILARINLALRRMTKDGTTRRILTAYEDGAGL